MSKHEYWHALSWRGGHIIKQLEPWGTYWCGIAQLGWQHCPVGLVEWQVDEVPHVRANAKECHVQKHQRSKATDCRNLGLSDGSFPSSLSGGPCTSAELDSAVPL